MTHIWVPKAKILEGEIGLKSGQVAGQYTIRKYKADTDELIQEVGPFDNLITDQGLNRVGTDAFGQYVFVGAGTATPSVSDTGLNSYKNYTVSSAPDGGWNSAILQGGSPDYWVQGAGTWRFAPGAATGTLTEVGIGWFAGPLIAANHRVSSRALIVDSGGSPISITVLADEYLDVTYSLRYYPYVGSDVVQTVVISGVNYIFTTRALGVGSSSYCSVNATGVMNWTGSARVYTGTAAGTPPALAAITATSMSNQGGNAAIPTTKDTYVDSSLQISAVFSAGLTEGNLTYGIRGMITRPTNSANPAGSFINSAFQSTISPAIPKDNTKILQFGASMSWSRKP